MASPGEVGSKQVPAGGAAPRDAAPRGTVQERRSPERRSPDEIRGFQINYHGKGKYRSVYHAPMGYSVVGISDGKITKKKDFIGKRSLLRKAFIAKDRQKVVGVVPIDKKTSIPEGSHLVRDAKAKLPNPKLGHISASCWSVEYNNPFSLAILHDGKNMIGQKLFALSPLKNKTIPVEIVSSHYVDPKGERVRS